MSKQRISNSPKTLEYLLNKDIPISDRLAEYNKHVNLAFEKGLYPSFNELVFDNEIGIEAFKIEKQKAIDTIQNKQRTLDYESFVRYLFYEIGVFDNKRTIHGTETIIYDITPIDKQQAEILERVSIEYAKANAGTYIKEALKIGNKTLLVPFILFDNLKTALQDSLEKPFANKQQVIAYYKKQHLEPLQDTKNKSTAQTIYRNFKAGKTIRNKEKDYLYYATKGAVMELLEFENYLNQNDVWEQENQQTENQTSGHKPKYIWKSKHALSEFYKKVNDNFFENLNLDDFLDVFTENSNKKLNAINYKQQDTGYLFDNVKPYFIDKVQANYRDWISTKVLFNGKEKEAKAISEILNFHKRKKVEYKESIDEILKSLTAFIK